MIAHLLAMLPMAVPGLVLGLGYVFFVNARWNPLGFLYGTLPCWSINAVAHFYTVAHITSLTALKQIDPEFESVSASLKVPFWRTFARVTVPICLPSILDIAVYIFVNALTTVSAVIFLYGADTKLASIAIVHMDEMGASAAAAGMATMIVLTALGAKLLQILLDRVLFMRLQAWRQAMSTHDAPVTMTAPSESESDTNLSPQRRAWAEKNLDAEARTLLAEDEKIFPAPVGLDAVPQRHRQGRRHLDRGHGRPPLHGFPRQQRASHRLRPSAAEARDRRADGRAAVRAAPLHLRAGGRAGREARRDRAGQSLQGAVHHRRLGRVEVAIKIARAATGRYKTLSFWDAFHGAGFGAAAVGGEALFRSGGVGPLMPGAEHVAPYAAYRCPYGTRPSARARTPARA